MTTSPGIQLANDESCRDALVVARIFTGAPFASNIGHGLQATSQYFRVDQLEADGRTVRQFDQRLTPAAALGLFAPQDVEVLGELTLGGDPLINPARMTTDARAVRLLRKTRPNAVLARLRPGDRDEQRVAASRQLESSLLRRALEKLAGCFAIHCASQLRGQLQLHEAAGDAEQLLKLPNSYFGGFCDGEAGSDEAGSDVFGNWSIATLCFGDEIRERTPAHTGFKAISENAMAEVGGSLFEPALAESLKMIFATGYPGAMLSLVMQNLDDVWIVAKEAIGSRFQRILPLTRRHIGDPDILAKIVREQRPDPLFIPDSALEAECDSQAVRESGIVSQYLLPLYGWQRTLIAILQFDVGDLRRRRRTGIYAAEAHILQALGAMVGATLMRGFNYLEAELGRQLDQVLVDSMNAATLDAALQLYISRVCQVFGVEMGHLRLHRTSDNTLEMVAGRGHYYEAFKLLRQKVEVDSGSPTARAFRQKEAVVVNDALSEDWWKSALSHFRDDPQAHAAMEAAGGFANVPIINGAGHSVGTISLHSAEPWFFIRPRVRALETLGRQAAHLLDYFSLQKERNFLLAIGSDFVREADFTRPSKTIEETVNRLRQAADAHIAALFVWDEEAASYILRAEAGWAEQDWADAARYGRGERWTGRVALRDAPEYVPDMLAYKRAVFPDEDREYETRVFGRRLAQDFNYEAIGLPLRLKRKDSIGVLTLYRKLEPSRSGQGRGFTAGHPDNRPKGPSAPGISPLSSGFTTINPDILQETADTISSLLSSLLYNLKQNWRAREWKRQEEVRAALERGDAHTPLEQRLCQQIVTSYDLRYATLFLTTDDATNPSQLRWAAAHDQRLGIVLTPSAATEEARRAATTQQLQECKKGRLSEAEYKIPKVAKTEGLLQRAALPLVADKELLGVLELHFHLTRRDSPLVAPHDPTEMTRLADKIATVYQRQRAINRQAEIELKAEKGRLAVQAMGAMVFQTAHRLTNLTQSIRSLCFLIQVAESDEARQTNLARLYAMINAAADGVQRPMNIARQMRAVRAQPFDLRALVNEVRREPDFAAYPAVGQIIVNLPDPLPATADRALTREALRNIMHNALKAMPDGGSLTIEVAGNEEATGGDARVVRLSFTDTGVGMSQAQIDAALSGFVTTQSSTGLGVLVSLLLLRAQSGDLKIESEEGVGTRVLVTLPTDHQEAQS